MTMRSISVTVIESVRGLPIVLLVLLAVYLPYPLLGIRVPGVILATASFALYAGVYLAEIIRSGFRSVDDGHLDAARVLGLSEWQIFSGLKLPMALRTMLPALLGVAITVFKDTSILMLVAVPDLSWTVKQLTVAQPVDHLLILFLLVVIYGGCASLASALVGRLDAALGVSSEPTRFLEEKVS